MLGILGILPGHFFLPRLFVARLESLTILLQNSGSVFLKSDPGPDRLSPAPLALPGLPGTGSTHLPIAPHIAVSGRDLGSAGFWYLCPSL